MTRDYCFGNPRPNQFLKFSKYRLLGTGNTLWENSVDVRLPESRCKNRRNLSEYNKKIWIGIWLRRIVQNVSSVWKMFGIDIHC